VLFEIFVHPVVDSPVTRRSIRLSVDFLLVNVVSAGDTELFGNPLAMLNESGEKLLVRLLLLVFDGFPGVMVLGSETVPVLIGVSSNSMFDLDPFSERLSDTLFANRSDTSSLYSRSYCATEARAFFPTLSFLLSSLFDPLWSVQFSSTNLPTLRTIGLPFMFFFHQAKILLSKGFLTSMNS